MKLRNLTRLTLLAVFALTCSKPERYPGFTETESGIFYQLLTVGEDSLRPLPGDYVTVNLQYMTMDDSVFFSSGRKLQIGTPAYKGSIDECFTMLSAEESALFIIPAYNFFTVTLQNSLPSFLSPEDSLKIKIEMLEIQTKEQFNLEKEAFLSWIEDFGDYEKVILKQFISEERLDVKPTASGIYYLKMKEGNGKIVEKGDTVTVEYEGRFLNGRFFDSTKKRKMPFQFVYGTEWQVIKGLEEAIGMMHEGEKSLFILPSELAFGKEGSSSNIIPPFTSLIFEVEILKVSSPVSGIKQPA